MTGKMKDPAIKSLEDFEKQIKESAYLTEVYSILKLVGIFEIVYYVLRLFDIAIVLTIAASSHFCFFGMAYGEKNCSANVNRTEMSHAEAYARLSPYDKMVVDESEFHVKFLLFAALRVYMITFLFQGFRKGSSVRLAIWNLYNLVCIFINLLIGFSFVDPFMRFKTEGFWCTLVYCAIQLHTVTVVNRLLYNLPEPEVPNKEDGRIICNGKKDLGKAPTVPTVSAKIECEKV